MTINDNFTGNFDTLAEIFEELQCLFGDGETYKVEIIDRRQMAKFGLDASNDR